MRMRLLAFMGIRRREDAVPDYTDDENPCRVSRRPEKLEIVGGEVEDDGPDVDTDLCTKTAVLFIGITVLAGFINVLSAIANVVGLFSNL